MIRFAPERPVAAACPSNRLPSLRNWWCHAWKGAWMEHGRMKEGTALAVGSCGRLSARSQTGWLVAVFTLSTFSCAPISLLFPLLLSSLRTLRYSLSPSRPSFIRCAHYRARRRFASTSCPPHTQLWHGQTTQHASSVRPRACRPNIEWSLSTFNAPRRR